MLTVFSIPKAFVGHIGIIQRNAIQSWLHLRPACEIVLCGDDHGVAEIASEFGVRHIPDIACNDYGTPLLSSAFERVLSSARHRLVCYVNTDIMLLSSLVSCAEQIPFPRFLMTGQRWDLDVTGPIVFAQSDWERLLRERAMSQGVLGPPGAVDYFLFPQGTVHSLPEFAVGRPGWDNWFIYHVRSSKVPVVDSTPVNVVIHQNHGYGHIPDKREDSRWAGPEADRNLELVGDSQRHYTLLDATHSLTEAGLRPALDRRHIEWRVRRGFQRRPFLARVARPVARLLGIRVADTP